MTGPVSVTIDEMEAQSATTPPPAQDLTAIKLEGADVPELLRGKSIADVVKQYGSMEQALRTSEAARTQQSAPTSPPAPVTEEPTDLTNEQLNELYQEDPIRAMATMQAQSDRKANKNLEARLAPLAASTAAQVEMAARAKYADEFALFGGEISTFVQGIPNNRQVMSNPAAWDDLIALIRGRPGNFERLVEAKTRTGPPPTLEGARQQQQESAGFNDNAGPKARRLTVATLDPVQKEIAHKMGLTEAEYVTWGNVS